MSDRGKIGRSKSNLRLRYKFEPQIAVVLYDLVDPLLRKNLATGPSGALASRDCKATVTRR